MGCLNSKPGVFAGSSNAVANEAEGVSIFLVIHLSYRPSNLSKRKITWNMLTQSLLTSLTS